MLWYVSLTKINGIKNYKLNKTVSSETPKKILENLYLIYMTKIFYYYIA